MTTFNTKRTLLNVIENSVGSRMFSRLFLRKGRVERDILEDGRLACAYFVSSVLAMFGLVKSQHATVSGLVADLEKSGWYKIVRPKVGAVMLWEPADQDGTINRHVGFCVSKDEAISNSSSMKRVQRHHLRYGLVGKRPKRKIEAVYWHPMLDDKKAAK